MEYIDEISASLRLRVKFDSAVRHILGEKSRLRFPDKVPLFFFSKICIGKDYTRGAWV